MWRLELGTFVRPAEETGTGSARVDTVLGYVAQDALHKVGLATGDVDLVVNRHLHFDHIGGNPSLGGRPIYCQRVELASAHTTDYTVPRLVDFAGARYELLDGEAEIAPGVHIIPTPGHVDGHQSVVLAHDAAIWVP